MIEEGTTTKASSSGGKSPRVSIGLPVYNGDKYLELALQSIVEQDYDDIELIIGDNASCDRTQEICERFAAEHSWVTYLRSDINRGAAWNYNRLVAPARGEFFMWMAHDDVFAPTLVRKSVEVLDRTPRAVLCTVGVQDIDEHGEPTGSWWLGNPRRSKDPAIRFGDAIRRPQWHQSFALIRRSVLDRTRLFGTFLAADGVFLAELALRGEFAEIPEPLFLNRQHAGSSTEAFPSPRQRLSWWNPESRVRVPFPMWRLLREYFNAIRLAPVPLSVKGHATVELVSWALVMWKSLAGDIVRAPKRFFNE